MMTDQAESSTGPVCHWQAVPGSIIAEHAAALTQIDAIADDILRIRVAPQGRLAPRRSWQEAAAPPAGRLCVEQQAHVLHLETGAMRARLDLESGTVALLDAEGSAYADDLAPVRWRLLEPDEVSALAPALAPAIAQQAESAWPAGSTSVGLWLHKALNAGVGIYGCGQRFGALDRRGQRLAHWTTDINSPGLGLVDGCLYQSHPVLLAVRAGLAWGLMLGSSGYSHFDLGAERADALGIFSLGSELDYYLFAGPTPAAVVEQITRLSGRPSLPPRWALGYHQSRWGYRSDAQIRALANEFRRRRIPIDAVHLDIDYMDEYRVFSWSPTGFPSPRATVEALHQQDIQVVTIIDPGVKREQGPDSGYPVYASGLEEDHFIRRPDGSLFSGYVWPGESLFPDFCRTATRRWWGDLHAGLLEAGIDGIWCDMNEPAIVDRPFDRPGSQALAIPLHSRQGDDAETCHAEAHNLYGTLMARATYDGLRRLRPQRRPWVLTRSASIGAQRWTASWMGDNASTWDDLRTSLAQLASMGLSGSAHVGVDIGGFYGDCDGELFARWIELGAFYPFMRGHAHHGSPPQEPWAFGDWVERVARTAIERRYRFLPYLYTLAHRAQRSGEPMFRPLLYDFPQQSELHAIDDQIMVGPQLMIAPVCAPGITERDVQLPPGVWYDFHSGKRIDAAAQQARGGDLETGASATTDAEHGLGKRRAGTDRRVRLPAPPGRMPILVRGGSCLTLGPLRQSTREPLTELTLDAYPGDDQDGRWTLIEDAGDGAVETLDALAQTEYVVTSGRSGPRLIVEQRQGGWQPDPRRLQLRLHAAQPPDQVLLDAEPCADGCWSQACQAAVVSLADDGKAHQLSLE